MRRRIHHLIIHRVGLLASICLARSFLCSLSLSLTRTRHDVGVAVLALVRGMLGGDTRARELVRLALSFNTLPPIESHAYYSL